MRFLHFLLILITFHFLQSQSKYLDQELQLIVENDAFTFDFFTDRYYSQGFFFKYRKLDTSKTKKRIYWMGINHRIFTPRYTNISNYEYFDRPYAGQISLSFGRSHFTEKSLLHYNLELGMMGKIAKPEELQRLFHSFFGMSMPRGWAYQINDSPIINGYFTYRYLIKHTKKFQFITDINLAGGTDFSYVSPKFYILYGKMKSFSHSVFNDGNLGYNKKKSKKTVEKLLFVAMGTEYVFYNSTIAGNLIGKPSIHTEDFKNWIFRATIGGILSWSSFDLKILYHFNTQETWESWWHKYVGIHLSQRF